MAILFRRRPVAIGLSPVAAAASTTKEKKQKGFGGQTKPVFHKKAGRGPMAESPTSSHYFIGPTPVPDPSASFGT